MKYLRLALSQINPTVGDLSGNAKRIIRYIRQAKKKNADIVVFPELSLTGYPPEDLVLKPQFIADNISELRRIGSTVSGIIAVVGFVDQGGKGELYNSAAVLASGGIVDVYHKIMLPNYGVFDEVRYFRPGRRVPVYRLKGLRFGINICEDIWHREGRIKAQSREGAGVIININASPYEIGKHKRRKELIRRQASDNRVVVAYLNTVGGQDELVFDGRSMICGPDGNIIARGKPFAEEMLLADIDLTAVQQCRRAWQQKNSAPAKKACQDVVDVRLPSQADSPRRTLTIPVLTADPAREEEIYRALVLGTHDYIVKNGFKGAAIGLSGGIDSSLVAAVAADALGKQGVTGVFMPSVYTSKESREDAYELSRNLGIRILEIPIGPMISSFRKGLGKIFQGLREDTTEENLQARIRGNLLMALSNKFGWIVLTTGNKSEMSVGYATLYGDMAGGFAVIKDVPKTLVYVICRWGNEAAAGPFIPGRVLVKAPTAELRPDQKDSDSLPPYSILDPILRAYIEDEKSFEDILALGYDAATVKRVIMLVDRSEYKRRQSPPGVKITGRAFGRDRRFPITNKYRSY